MEEVTSRSNFRLKTEIPERLNVFETSYNLAFGRRHNSFILGEDKDQSVSVTPENKRNFSTFNKKKRLQHICPNCLNANLMKEQKKKKYLSNKPTESATSIYDKLGAYYRKKINSDIERREKAAKNTYDVIRKNTNNFKQKLQEKCEKDDFFKNTIEYGICRARERELKNQKYFENSANFKVNQILDNLGETTAKEIEEFLIKNNIKRAMRTPIKRHKKNKTALIKSNGVEIKDIKENYIEKGDYNIIFQNDDKTVKNQKIGNINYIIDQEDLNLLNKYNTNSNFYTIDKKLINKNKNKNNFESKSNNNLKKKHMDTMYRSAVKLVNDLYKNEKTEYDNEIYNLNDRYGNNNNIKINQKSIEIRKRADNNKTLKKNPSYTNYILTNEEFQKSLVFASEFKAECDLIKKFQNKNEDKKLLNYRLSQEKRQIEKERQKKKKDIREFVLKNDQIINEKLNNKKIQKNIEKIENEKILNELTKKIKGEYTKNMKRKMEYIRVSHDNYKRAQNIKENDRLTKAKNNIEDAKYNGLEFKGFPKKYCDNCKKNYPRNVLSVLYTNKK